MQVQIFRNCEQLSKATARIIADQVKRKPNSVLGLATGSTPVGAYKELVRMHKEEGLDFSQVMTFNLDEYVGLKPDHDQSYHCFMADNLFNHINVKPESIHIPDGMAKDAEAHCHAYEQAICAAGGIDIQILGIGSNGHIAFNEPGSSLASVTRKVSLTPQTIRDNSRFFEKEEDVPRYAISMGIGTILKSRVAILMATGQYKADAIAKSIEGCVTAMVPASALQMHPRPIFMVDSEAAAKLSERWRLT